MLDVVILWVLAAGLLFPAGWLTIGAFENLIHPPINETFTSEVMDMARIRADYPEAYTLVAYRRITNPRLTRAAFRLVVAWELAAMVGLWLGVGALAGAGLGWVTPDSALALGLIGAAMFTATWTGFLVVGNWFCYWFGHEGAQNTHFQMTLWGIGNIGLLLLGAVLL